MYYGFSVHTFFFLVSRLLHLVVSTNHDCYVKLVVSGLDYSMDGMPRYVNYKAKIFVLKGRVFNMLFGLRNQRAEILYNLVSLLPHMMACCRFSTVCNLSGWPSV